MGLDHIKEPLSGRLSSRLVLVVSDLVSRGAGCLLHWVDSPYSSPRINGHPHWRFSQSILNICSLTWVARALLSIVRHGRGHPQACFQVKRHKGGNHRFVRCSSMLLCQRILLPTHLIALRSMLLCQRVLLPTHLIALGRLCSNKPVLLYYRIDAVRGQPGLIHSSQLMFDVHEDHSSGIPTCEIP